MLAFAHRGGLGLSRRNTLAAFRRAVAAGAVGLETDVWCGPDGRPVIVHDRPAAHRLGALPTLADLYAAVGVGVELSVDVKEPTAAAGAVACARDAGGDEALGRLWLCAGRGELAAWRPAHPGVHLVLSVDRLAPDDIAWATRTGVDAVNQPARRWTAAQRAEARAAGVLAFGWACNTGWTLRRARRLALDAVYSDRLDIVRAAASG